MNKRGFVLAEAIIVAVFILGMFSYLAINILPLITKYDKAQDYDNLTEVYLVNDLYEEIKVRGIAYDPQVGDYRFTKEDSEITCKLNNNTHTKEFCADDMKKYAYDILNISEIYVITKELAKKDFYKKQMSRAMREYYNYSVGKDKEMMGKIILVKFQNGRFARIAIEEDVDYDAIN